MRRVRTASALLSLASIALTISGGYVVGRFWEIPMAHWVACAEFCAALVMAGAAMVLLLEGPGRHG